MPSVPLLQVMGRCPIPQVRRPRAQPRLTEEPEEGGFRTWEVPKCGLSISSTPLSSTPIFRIQSPVKGEGEGKTEGLVGAGKAQSTSFGSLQGLAGERGTTGPSVSVGLCRWATSRAVGSDMGGGAGVCPA